MLRIERNLERDHMILLVVNIGIYSLEFSIEFTLLLIVDKWWEIGW